MEGKSWFEKLKSSVSFRRKAEPIAVHWPEWYRTYAAVCEDLPQPTTPTSALRFVVLDAETTGLEIKKDRLLSIGALKVSNNIISTQDRFEAYFPTPEAWKDYDSVSIHGIIPQSKRYDYSQEEKLLADLLAYLGNAVIVGHGIGFDLEMINLALGRLGAGKLRNRVVDTGQLAQRVRPVGYWSPPDDFSLDKLGRRYRIPLSDRHTALGDAYITAVLLLKLTARLSERKDRALRLEDLL